MASGAPPTVCHRLPPSVRIALTLAVIISGIAVPARNWPVWGVLGCLVFAGHSLAGVPLNWLLKRLLIFLPFAGTMAISLPLSQGLARGWDLMFEILCRATLAFLSSLWLVSVMPFDQLLVTLRRWKFPVVLVAILSFMHRSIFLVWEELDSLRTAHQARSFGKGSLWFRWKSLAGLLGMLLLRSLSRAERTHAAMRSRGWTGEIHWLDD